MNQIDRGDLPSDYADLIKAERHHDHKIIDKDGIIRWEENPGVREVVDICGLNNIIMGMHEKGIGKSDERYRHLYRNMGYSLSSYWDVFYEEINNDDAEEYRSRSKVE